MNNRRWNWLLGLVTAGALIAHFWPMSYWSNVTTLLLRITAAFCGQLLFCRAVKRPGWKTLPLLLAGLFALWGGWLGILSGNPGYWDYSVPLLACLAGWLLWNRLEKRHKEQLAPVGKTLGLAFLLSITLIPALLFMMLYFGWPPVIGNLTAAQAMKQYAAQVHPDWKAEDIWADFNLVSDGHFQMFLDGAQRYELNSDWRGSWIADDQRAEAYRREHGVDQLLDTMNKGSDYVWYAVVWSTKTPDTPRVTLGIHIYDSPNAAVPDEKQMREKMAVRTMLAYEKMAAISPIHQIRIAYHHDGLDEHNWMEWYEMDVNLPDGRPLEREDMLNGTLTKD